MYDSIATSPAEHILNMGQEQEVHGLMAELARKRQLSLVVRKLNAAVLDGPEEARNLAVAALSRMGLWVD